MYFLKLTVKKSDRMYVRKMELNCTFICASLQILDLLWPPRKSLGQLCGKIMEEWQSIGKKKCAYYYAVNTPSRQVIDTNSLCSLCSEQMWNWCGITHKCNEYLTLPHKNKAQSTYLLGFAELPCLPGFLTHFCSWTSSFYLEEGQPWQTCNNLEGTDFNLI